MNQSKLIPFSRLESQLSAICVIPVCRCRWLLAEASLTELPYQLQTQPQVLMHTARGLLNAMHMTRLPVRNVFELFLQLMPLMLPTLQSMELPKLLTSTSAGFSVLTFLFKRRTGFYESYLHLCWPTKTNAHKSRAFSWSALIDLLTWEGANGCPKVCDNDHDFTLLLNANSSSLDYVLRSLPQCPIGF